MRVSPQGSTVAPLSVDVLREVYKFAGPATALELERTCTALRRVSYGHAADAEVWRELYANEFGHEGRRPLALEHLPVLRGQPYPLGDWRREVQYDMEMQSMECVQTLENFMDEVWVARWSPCGHYLGLGCKDAKWAVYTLCRTDDGGLTLELYDADYFSKSVAMLDWCPDSSKILFNTTGDQVFCYTLAEKSFYETSVVTSHFDCYARWCNTTEFLTGADRSPLLDGAPSWQDMVLYRVAEEGKKIHRLRSIKLCFRDANTVHFPQPVVTGDGEVFAVFAGCMCFKTCGPCHLGVAPLNSTALRSETLNIHTHHAKDGPSSDDSDAGPASVSLTRSSLREVSVPLQAQPGAIIGISVQHAAADSYILLNIRPFEKSLDGAAPPPQPSTFFPPRALSSNIVMQLSRVSDGKIVKRFEGHRGFSSDTNPFLSWPSVSPFSPHVAVGSEDFFIYIYNLNHEHVVAKIQGHEMLVNCVMWHPHLPDVLISSSDDCTAKLWRARTSKAQLQHVAFFHTLRAADKGAADAREAAVDLSFLSDE